MQEFLDRLGSGGMRTWGAIAWVLTGLLTIPLLLTALRRKRLGPQTFWKVGFLAGVLTLAVFAVLAAKAITLGIGVSIPGRFVVAFPLLAIDTGVAGFLAFTSFWRYPPLVLTLLGLLMIVLLAVYLH